MWSRNLEIHGVFKNGVTRGPKTYKKVKNRVLGGSKSIILIWSRMPGRGPAKAEYHMGSHVAGTDTLISDPGFLGSPYHTTILKSEVSTG